MASEFQDSKIRPPERPCSRCNCCMGRWRWRQDRGGCWNPYFCSPCQWASAYHGFSSHKEYEHYLDKGCWVCGGKADRIDHDHDIHPQTGHSCSQCRRGPACAGCNKTLRTGRTSDDLFSQRDIYLDRANSVELAAIALKSWELSRERTGN
jgi:hypothetical protein